MLGTGCLEDDRLLDLPSSQKDEMMPFRDAKGVAFDLKQRRPGLVSGSHKEVETGLKRGWLKPAPGTFSNNQYQIAEELFDAVFPFGLFELYFPILFRHHSLQRRAKTLGNGWFPEKTTPKPWKIGGFERKQRVKRMDLGSNLGVAGRFLPPPCEELGKSHEESSFYLALHSGVCRGAEMRGAAKRIGLWVVKTVKREPMLEMAGEFTAHFS